MLTILTGDAIEQLRTLPDESVQCCVTSPPYWGLRDYGTSAWEGGDIACDHSPKTSDERLMLGSDGKLGRNCTSWTSRDSTVRTGGDCKCGAKRIDSQLGLEKTPDEYVAKMVEVFREVRRVLRKDGTLWLNLGDSFVGGNNTNQGGNANFGSQPGRDGMGETAKSQWKGLPAKNLVGIPWRVAFALQADGWWLRSDIIWAKPNPMPESVTDRPTKAHEYLFLLTKNANYFYDNEAIREPQETLNPMHPSYRACVLPRTNGCAVNRGARKSALLDESVDTGRKWVERRVLDPAGRNKRSVWTVATAPYPEAHFATYPPDLIKPCIMAGTKCGDVVLDCFAGSGTTGAVALELGRKAVLIELNPKYVELIRQRCDITPGLQLA